MMLDRFSPIATRSLVVFMACALLFGLSIVSTTTARAYGDGDDDDRTRSTSNSETVISADCRYYGTGLQAAIDRANGPTTIVVKGTCTEKVLIRKDDITITGDRYGTGRIRGRVNGKIRIEGSDRIVIKFLRVTGMGEGIDVVSNSSADISDCVIKDNELDGIRVIAASSASVERCVIAGNDLNSSGRGIALFQNSTLFLGGGNDIRNNGGENGANLWLETGSDVFQFGDDKIIDNDAEQNLAIHLLNGARADIRGAEILGDIFVHGNSTFRTQVNEITGNISVSAQSLVGFRSNVDFFGTLTCDDSSEPFGPEVFLAAVACGETCNGAVPGTCAP